MTLRFCRLQSPFRLTELILYRKFLFDVKEKPPFSQIAPYFLLSTRITAVAQDVSIIIGSSAWLSEICNPFGKAGECFFFALSPALSNDEKTLFSTHFLLRHHRIINWFWSCEITCIWKLPLLATKGNRRGDEKEILFRKRTSKDNIWSCDWDFSSLFVPCHRRMPNNGLLLCSIKNIQILIVLRLEKLWERKGEVFSGKRLGFYDHLNKKGFQTRSLS